VRGALHKESWAVIEDVNELKTMLNVEYSPPRRGGVAAASTKSREATEGAADGVVSSAKSSGVNSFAELTIN